MNDATIDPVREQRLAALKRGNEIRHDRAAMKGRFKALTPRDSAAAAGTMLAAPPANLSTMSTFEFVKAIRYFGDHRTRKLLGAIAITPTRKLIDLTPRQRRDLARALAVANRDSIGTAPSP